MWANYSLSKKDPKYAIELPTALWAYTPTKSADRQTYGYTVNATATDKSLAVSAGGVSPVPPDSGQSAALGASPEMVYVVVTATITPTPTYTPNPYGTLHATASALWHAFTVTPALATMWAKPLYDMASGDCFQNCGFITATPRPLIYNP